MPLYVVRWPGFNASLVKARNEQELLSILDEEDDPGSCRYAVYRGPLWLNFDLPLEPTWDDGRLPATADIAVSGVDKLTTAEVMPYEISISGSDTGDEMRNAISSFAFPHLHALLTTCEDSETPSPKAVAQAVSKELTDLARYLWRREHIRRANDPKSAMLRNLGLTKAPPWLEAIWSSEPPEDDAD